jgi:hypothetical protein
MVRVRGAKLDRTWYLIGIGKKENLGTAAAAAGGGAGGDGWTRIDLPAELARKISEGKEQS